MNPSLSPTQYARFSADCVARYPEEACGVIVHGRYIPIKNVAEDKEHGFSLDKTELLQALLKGPIQAILHSHPFNPRAAQEYPPEWPSVLDQETWLKGSIPWGIVACEGENITEQHRMVWLNEGYISPLLGRTYTWAQHDCFSIVRDWYRLNRELTLPNLARDFNFWKKGSDFIEDNFRQMGFQEISRANATVGDALLIKLPNSKVISHCAVITGTNEILHHGAMLLSSHAELARWAGYAKRVVRYVGNPGQEEQDAP